MLIALALACDPQLLDRRRADDGARRDGAGAGPAAARATCSATFGLGVALHHARPVDARRRRATGSPSCTPGGSSRRARAASVFAAAAHPYTRALAAAFPMIGDPAFRMNPSGLAGDPPDPRELPSGCPFHPRCPDVRRECPRAAIELWPPGRSGARPASRSSTERARRPPTAPAASRPPATPRCSSCEDIQVRFAPAAGAVARAVDGVDLDRPPGRGPRARRRVGLRQDDARAHDPRARAPARRARSASTASRSATTAAALQDLPARGADGLPGPDRRAQPAPDDLRGRRRGAAHPEVDGRRGGARRGRARARRPAPARAVLRPSTRTSSPAASASGS